MTFNGKIIFFVAGVFCLTSHAVAQDQKIADSLSVIYKENTLTDTAKMKVLRLLAFNEVRDLKLASQYADELIILANQYKNDYYLFHGFFQKGNKNRLTGDLKDALYAYFESAKIAKRSGTKSQEGSAYNGMGDVYDQLNNYQNAMLYYNKAITTLRQSPDSTTLASTLVNVGDGLVKYKIYDTALSYYKEAGKIFEKKNYLPGKAYTLGNVGMLFAKTGKNNLAEKNINEAIAILQRLGDYYPVCDYLLSMCDIYVEKGDNTTALNYALRSLQLAEQQNFKEQIRDANFKLSKLYEVSGDDTKSLRHFKVYVLYKDSINDYTTIQKMADQRTNFEVSQKQAEVNLLSKQKKLQRILLITSFIVLSIIIVLVLVLLKNNRQKQKAYMLVRKEKEFTEQQRDQTNKALKELKRTQAHLIQSEKMASLGELTAGIAHEIQNPLNFVNNFSELNSELITELQEENRKGNLKGVEALSDQIFNNAERISQHGKRAGAIVKGMLEHSRAGGPEKRPANINTLVDEYFRLAYLGLRAKDKSFNATMRTDFDPEAAEINIVPQEIGRVILNLATNAFHAVAAKSKEAQAEYTPTVTIQTKKQNSQLLISVKDNGIGIPPSLKEKIFQPFFTTKAPGLGTGLGLSISYDIVKAHGGEIKVESNQETGSEFLVILPLEGRVT